MALEFIVQKDMPGAGDRRQLELFRDSTNTWAVVVKNPDGTNATITGWAMKAAGKEHESDANEIFDVSGTPDVGNSKFTFTATVSAGAPAFGVGGHCEYRWFTGGLTSGTPSGRFRMPMRITAEIGEGA